MNCLGKIEGSFVLEPVRYFFQGFSWRGKCKMEWTIFICNSCWWIIIRMAPGCLDRWVKCLPLDLMSGLHFTIYLIKGVGGEEWPQWITDPWIQTPLQYDIGTLPIVYFSTPSNLYSRQYTCSSLCNFQLKRFGSFRFHILGTLRPHTANNPRRIKLPLRTASTTARHASEAILHPPNPVKSSDN